MLKLPINNDTKFGKIIKLVRTSMDMTQKELAKELKVSSTIICFIESGKNFPSDSLFDRLWKFITDNKINVDERTFRIAYDISRGKVDLKGMSIEKKMLTAKLATGNFTKTQLELLDKFINGSIDHGKKST